MSSDGPVVLSSFFRSSAAWRVRIALHLKGIAYDYDFRNFRKVEQRSPDYLTRNPQGLVPALQVGATTLTQSLAIIEYLDEAHRHPPLLPNDPIARAKTRAMAQIVACDIHPINNLRVLDYLRTVAGRDEDAINTWYRHWVTQGFDALEALVTPGEDAVRCDGSSNDVSIADICLVPQMYNARRFAVDLTPYPKLVAIDATLAQLPAFTETAPEVQPDAV